MTSVLGLIQLGEWELGADVPQQALSGSFTAVANPAAIATGLGGVPQTFTSVPGVILLGAFELGQLSGEDLNAANLSGRGFFSAKAFPDVGIPQPVLALTFSAAGFPDAVAMGNLGAVLIRFVAFPDVNASGVNYYSEGSFTAGGAPDIFLIGRTVSYLLATAAPDVQLFPLTAQQVDCVAGENPPDASALRNAVY